MSRHHQDLAVPVSAVDHALGAEHSPVTVVEYGDFECPICKHALAPQGSEPPFAITQGIVLVFFVAAGYLAVRRFHPVAARPQLALG